TFKRDREVMLKGFALIFAIFFIGLGIVEFIPPLRHNQLLFNLFEVNSVHNLFHILVGFVALSASVSAVYAKLYFKFFGIVFALIAILGFALNGNLSFLQVNLADSFFYAIVALITLYLGFTSKSSTRQRCHLA
ncbi:MAG: DUF4383 domain-containing protein, partial [Rickettsiella sp.]|nr:DUF4383 domain-containing protein [Rickettsiella sp.]